MESSSVEESATRQLWLPGDGDVSWSSRRGMPEFCIRSPLNARRGVSMSLYEMCEHVIRCAWWDLLLQSRGPVSVE